MKESECPECDKALKIKNRSQTIGEFLDWLQNEQGIILGKYGNEEEGQSEHSIYPIYVSAEKLLAQYFEIDQTRWSKKSVLY